MNPAHVINVSNLVNSSESGIAWWAIGWQDEHFWGLIPCTSEITNTPQRALADLHCSGLTIIRFTPSPPSLETQDIEVYFALQAACQDLEPPTPDDDPGPWSIEFQDLLIVGSNAEFCSVRDHLNATTSATTK